MLTKKQLHDIKTLQDICETKEQIKLKLNWQTLRTRNDEEKNDFFYYQKEELIGYLALYKFGNETEICGMVHPNHRCRGIFTQLCNEALSTIAEGEQILINAPADSKSAKEWIMKQNGTFAFSEFQMKWEKQDISHEPIIRLRKATVLDAETIIELNKLCFGIENEDINDVHQLIENDKSKSIYMIEKDDSTLGKIHVNREVEESWIVAFAMFPKHQGKGYGRNALTQTVLLESKITGNDIYLEVALENLNALRLYEQCGFAQFHTQDYYSFGR